MREPQVVTTSERHDLDEQAEAAARPGWPEFIFHDPTSSEFIGRVETYFPRIRRAAAGQRPGRRGRLGRIPIQSKRDSQHPAERLRRSIDQRRDWPRNRGSGRHAMHHGRSRQAGLPGRRARRKSPGRTAGESYRGKAGTGYRPGPALKSRYPLTPMENFARWTRADGTHIDPWIRTHQRLGATILAPSPRSMVVTGTVGEWEDWARMSFPETGQYVVPDALDLVSINCEEDCGTYAETNLWMRHL